MRKYSKKVVLRFDEAVKEAVPEEDLKKFIEVADIIMELIANKKIYNEEIRIK